jgi:hypothetical protein
VPSKVAPRLDFFLTFFMVEDHRPLPEPTTAPAGSEAKLAEFARRARLDLQLFHPNDPRDGTQAATA